MEPMIIHGIGEDNNARMERVLEIMGIVGWRNVL